MIAQIKLLQLASNNYSFTPDSHFREWFAGVEKLSEAERSVASVCQLVLSLLTCLLQDLCALNWQDGCEQQGCLTLDLN